MVEEAAGGGDDFGGDVAEAVCVARGGRLGREPGRGPGTAGAQSPWVASQSSVTVGTSSAPRGESMPQLGRCIRQPAPPSLENHVCSIPLLNLSQSRRYLIATLGLDQQVRLSSPSREEMVE